MSLPLTWADKINSPLLADFIAKHGAEYCMTAEEINQMRDAINEMAVIQQSVFLGVVEPAATPTGTGANYWEVIVPGTYTNFGGVVLNSNSRGLIYRNAEGDFSISQIITPAGPVGPASTVPGPQGPPGNSSPTGVFTNLASLESWFPDGDDGIYITSDDGHWYFYKPFVGWQDGGLYQVPLQITGDIIATDGSDITSILQSSIDTLKFVSIKKAGTYLISSSIQMPSNSSLYLAAGVVLKLANGTNDEILTNANYAAGNENITVFGEGTFDCNGANNTNAGSLNTDPNLYQMTGILFKNCKNLTLKDFTVKNPKWFGIQLGKVTNFIVKDITFDYPDFGGDGLHINGQCHYGYVENLKSPYNITRDDLFALVAKDTPMFNIYEGAITNIKCNGISAKDSYNAVRIISAGYEVSDISINGISGTYQAHAVNIDDFRDYIVQYGTSIIRNITISNIRANVPTNQHGLIRFATKIQNITFNNITRIETGAFAVPTFKFDLYADVDLININNVIIDDYTTQAVNGHTGIRIANNAIVDILKINGYSHRYLGTNTYDKAGSFLFLDTATIKNLTIDNVNLKNLTTAIILSKSTILDFNSTNTFFENVWRLLQVNIEAGQTSNIPLIKLMNGTFMAKAETTCLFDFSATLSNPVEISTVNFKLNNFTGNPIIIQTGQSIAVSLNSPDIEINPTNPGGKLTPKLGDIVKRKSQGLSLNNGLAIFDGNNFIVLGKGANYSDSPPASGTYVRSDRVLHYLPWVGQPKSWICTAGGTPGTWVSEGNL